MILKTFKDMGIGSYYYTIFNYEIKKEQISSLCKKGILIDSDYFYIIGRNTDLTGNETELPCYFYKTHSPAYFNYSSAVDYLKNKLENEIKLKCTQQVEIANEIKKLTELLNKY